MDWKMTIVLTNYLAIMNKFIKIFSVILLCISLASCGIEQKMTRCIFVVKNNSSYTITLSGNTYSIHFGEYMSEEIVLRPNEVVKLYDYLTSPSYFWQDMTVTFDDKLSIIHTHDTSIFGVHSLCDDESYEIKKTKTHERKYTYTFTDADYDYAVQWNMEHGVEE